MSTPASHVPSRPIRLPDPCTAPWPSNSSTRSLAPDIAGGHRDRELFTDALRDVGRQYRRNAR